MTVKNFFVLFFVVFVMIFVARIATLPKTDIPVSLVDHVITFGIGNQNYFFKDRCDVQWLEDSAIASILTYVSLVFPNAGVTLVEEGDRVEINSPRFFLYYENINGYKRYTGLDTNHALHEEIVKSIGQISLIDFSPRNAPPKEEIRKNLLEEKLDPSEKNPLYTDAEMISLKSFTIAQIQILEELVNIGIEPTSLSLRDFSQLKESLEENWMAPYIVYVAEKNKDKYIFRNVFIFIAFSIATSVFLVDLKKLWVAYSFYSKFPTPSAKVFWIEFFPKYFISNFFLNNNESEGDLIHNSFIIWKNKKELSYIRKEARKLLDSVADIDTSNFLKGDQDRIGSFLARCRVSYEKIMADSKGQNMIYFLGELSSLRDNTERVVLAVFQAKSNLSEKKEVSFPSTMNIVGGESGDPKGDLLRELEELGVRPTDYARDLSNSQIESLVRITYSRGAEFTVNLLACGFDELISKLKDRDIVNKMIFISSEDKNLKSEEEKGQYNSTHCFLEGKSVILVGGGIICRSWQRICEELEEYFELSSCDFVNVESMNELDSAIKRKVDIFLLATDDISHKALKKIQKSRARYFSVRGTNIETIKNQMMFFGGVV